MIPWRILDPWEIKENIHEDTIMVSVMHVNNKTGAIQPIGEIAEIVKGNREGIVFHVDGIQSLGKIPINLKQSNIDLFSMSAHKIFGPKGVGAIYIRDKNMIEAF